MSILLMDILLLDYFIGFPKAFFAKKKLVITQHLAICPHEPSKFVSVLILTRQPTDLGNIISTKIRGGEVHNFSNRLNVCN